MTTGYRIGNQRGFVMVIALVMLLVLTLIGVSSILSAVFDTKIAGNERLGSAAFYAAAAGAEVGVDRLPSIDAYSGTLNNDETYRSGRTPDPGPQQLMFKGAINNQGDDVTMWEYKRYQINATGGSFGAKKEVELQAKIGPYVTGTQYNN